MAGDLLALSQWCNALPDRIDQAASDLAVEFVKATARDMIDHTPVDTTEAESNWQASNNSAPAFPLPAIYPGHKGSTAAQSAEAAYEHVIRATADKRPGERIFLSNLAPHIIALNAGSSKQEPAGFFERGVLVGELHIRRVGLGGLLK